jgi:hypothetical protein
VEQETLEILHDEDDGGSVGERRQSRTRPYAAYEHVRRDLGLGAASVKVVYEVKGVILA